MKTFQTYLHCKFVLYPTKWNELNHRLNMDKITLILVAKDR